MYLLNFSSSLSIIHKKYNSGFSHSTFHALTLSYFLSFYLDSVLFPQINYTICYFLSICIYFNPSVGFILIHPLGSSFQWVYSSVSSMHIFHIQHLWNFIPNDILKLSLGVCYYEVAIVSTCIIKSISLKTCRIFVSPLIKKIFKEILDLKIEIDCQ